MLSASREHSCRCTSHRLHAIYTSLRLVSIRSGKILWISTSVYMQLGVILARTLGVTCKSLHPARGVGRLCKHRQKGWSHAQADKGACAVLECPLLREPIPPDTKKWHRFTEDRKLTHIEPSGVRNGPRLSPGRHRSDCCTRLSAATSSTLCPRCCNKGSIGVCRATKARTTPSV